LKFDSNQNLVAVLKLERLKGAEIYAALIEGGGLVSAPTSHNLNPLTKNDPHVLLKNLKNN